MRTRRNRLPMMACPVCGARSEIALSQEMSHLTRRVYYRCQDIECGHNWQADLSFVKTISPSSHVLEKLMIMGLAIIWVVAMLVVVWDGRAQVCHESEWTMRKHAYDARLEIERQRGGH